MKRNIKLLISAIICASIIIVALGITGCASLTYSGESLSSGKVGEEYIAYVGHATGAEDIVYALKEGSALPSGLVLSEDGFIEGIPYRKTTDDQKFTVTAASGELLAEAEFSIKIDEGTLSYVGHEIKVARGAEFNINLATAEGVVAATYEITGGDLPEDVTLSEAGILSGTVNTILDADFTVKVTADDCVPASADFTLNVANPWIDYKKTALLNGNVDLYYTSSVASATNADNISYKLKEDSLLPDGLSLSPIGLIYGIPTTATNSTFTVVASAAGYTSAEAEFSIRIRVAAAIGTAAGTIRFKDTEFETKSYIQGQKYIDIGMISASATNRAKISYELSDGTLPSGLELYPNGTIAGTAGKAGESTFSITATAANCQPVTKEFTVAILNPQITYRSIDYSTDADNDLFVGVECSIDLATAVLPEGFPAAEIVYTAVASPPAGLSLSKAGVLTGVPERSYQTVQLSITASAEGFTSRSATFTFHIEDAIVSGITRFETELTDLRGLVGSGYSGSATGSGMIQTFDGVAASTNGVTISGGHFVGFTFNPIVHTYKISSSKASSGVGLVISLDSETGVMELNQTLFDIKVNGVSIGYDHTITASEENKFTGFKEYSLGSVNLKEGENIITLSVMTATIGGLGIDYIQFSNLGGAELSWRPANYNINK